MVIPAEVAQVLLLLGMITGSLGTIFAVMVGWTIADHRHPGDRSVIIAAFTLAVSVVSALLAIAVLQVSSAQKAADLMRDLLR